MKKIILLLLSGVSLWTYPALPARVNLVNTGEMHIALLANATTMYVKSDVKNVSASAVKLNGVWAIGGNFIQDSETNVFPTDKGYTTSTGTMVFVGEQGMSRYITATDFKSFDKRKQYVAFPHVKIETNDTIMLPAKMAIDALTVKRTGGKKGFLLLESGITENGAVYDASLRITGKGASEKLVTSGSVVVEQYMEAYRGGDQLMPFATPYKNTQLSGYFAGNWVRRLIREDNLHTVYTLGNKPSTTETNVIAREQYVIYAKEILQAGLPYLIKPRGTGFDYRTLQAKNGLAVTGAEASLYDQRKFTFNGRVYTIEPYEEQLFAEDTLFSYTFESAPAKTTNWVIGNSYPAPLSVQAIKEEMAKSSVSFLPYIYIYPAGSTSYQVVPLNEGAEIGDSSFLEIPSKGVFMLRVSKNQGTGIAGAEFTIGKQHLTHGNLSHNLRKEKIRSSFAGRDVSFRVTLAGNTNVYDLTAVGLRENAALNGDMYDIPKVYTTAKEGFQLYTTTLDNSKLSINGLPLETDSVLLHFKPQIEEVQYTLTVSQKGNNYKLWLKDLKTNEITDLQQIPFYTFTGTGTDPENRFIIYFTEPKQDITLVSSTDSDSNVYVKYSDNLLSICGLSNVDINSNLYVYDMLGRVIFPGIVLQYPQQDFNINLTKNTYIISIQGQRNFNFKIINK